MKRTNLAVEQVSKARNQPYLSTGLIWHVAEYFNGFTKRHPIVLPQSTPIYSNTAFRILSYAMEVITGRTYENIINKSIIQPLGLANTSVRKPQNNSLGIIPEGDSFWDYDIGDEAP